MKFTRDESLTGAQEERAIASVLDALYGREYYGFVAGKCSSSLAFSATDKEWAGRSGIGGRTDVERAVID